jgi:hypothetical protein
MLFGVLDGGVDEDVEEFVDEDLGLAAQGTEGRHGAGHFHFAADVVQQFVNEEARNALGRFSIVSDGPIYFSFPACVVEERQCLGDFVGGFGDVQQKVALA